MKTALIAVLAATIVLSGCSTKRQAGTMAVVGLGVMVVPPAVLLSNCEGEGCNGPVILALGSLVVGGVTVVGALVNMVVLDNRAARKRRPEAAPPASPANDLVRSAANLARRGDCPAAHRLLVRAGALDGPYTAAHLDEALGACP